MVAVGTHRFRSSMVFAERDALLDFVGLSKRGGLLPDRAQARQVEALAAVEPVTEEWVVTNPQR